MELELELVPLERASKVLSKCIYWSTISAFRRKLKIISYFQRFLHNFFTFYPKNPKRLNRQSANMAYFVAFCIGFQKNIPLQNPLGGRGVYGSSRSISCRSCKPFKSSYKSFASLHRVQIWHNLCPKTSRSPFTRCKKGHVIAFYKIIQ